MLGLTFADFIVIIVFFSVLILIGFCSISRIKNQKDYVPGGRRFGKVMQIFATFGQTIYSPTEVSTTTTTITSGKSGIRNSLTYIFNIQFYWIAAVFSRRLRVLTFCDYF